MQKSWTIILALTINLIVFGFYLFQGLHDYFTIEAYREFGFFHNLESGFLFLMTFFIPILAIIGMFKQGWACLICTLLAAITFAIFTIYLIQTYFDPLEQGRNGGMMPMISVAISLSILNLVAFVLSLKKKTQI